MVMCHQCHRLEQVLGRAEARPLKEGRGVIPSKLHETSVYSALVCFSWASSPVPRSWTSNYRATKAQR